MASIIDAYRETFSDNFSFFKIATFAIPVYFCYALFIGSKGDFTGFTWLTVITVFFLFGFLIKTTNGVLNEANSVLPSLNPLKLAFAAFKGIIAIGPITLITILLTNYICSLINIIPWLDITLKVILWFVAAAVIVTSFLMFVKREKIKDAYNIKLLFDKAGDLIVRLLVFIIQIVLINLVIAGFFAYTLIVLFGFGPVLDAFLAYVLVFNVGVIGHYLAQLQYESLGG